MTKASALRRKIGLAIINAMPANSILWDTELKGFCARRQKSETVSYLLKLRVNGRIRWVTIGRHGQPWTPDAARKRAMAILVNPELADKSTAQPQDATFATLVEQFMAKHGPKLKPRTLIEYRRMVDQYLVPRLGPKPVAAITRADVSAAHAAWSDTPRTANFALTVLSKFMSWAEDEDHRPDGSNPVRRVQRYKENKRERYLTAEELTRLGTALDKAEREFLVGPYVVAAIRLLILTGARLSEITTLRWSYVDFERSMIFLPDSKTGQKGIPLPEPALALIRTIPRVASNPYVIIGKNNGDHLKNIQKPWYVVRDLAGLPGLRIHDLRHTFASFSVAHGGSLPMIGAILGHSTPQTTQRYAHLAADSVRRLADTTGQALAAALATKTG